MNIVNLVSAANLLYWWMDRNNKPIVLQDSAAGLIKCCDSFKYLETTDLLIPNLRYTCPMDFVFDYMDQNHIDDSVLSKAGLDRRKKHDMSIKHIIPKIDVFRLIFVLKMPLPIAKQFMILAGYSFSPVISQDIFFLNYLNGKYGKINNLEELEDKANELNVEMGKKEHFPYPYWK